MDIVTQEMIDSSEMVPFIELSFKFIFVIHEVILITTYLTCCYILQDMGLALKSDLCSQ